MACRFTAVLRVRLIAVSDHGQCFTLERLKSATSKMLGNRSSGSSQSTGSAVFCGRATPSCHFVIDYQGSGGLPSRPGAGLGLVKPDV